MIITVFTPTYNRAYCLPKLYKSLCEQTSKDFLWLVVDDGSTDNTKELIKNYIDEGSIHIEYHWQKNGGKHVAHNYGVELCSTELFVCVDSDDALTPNAVQKVVSDYKNHIDNNILGMYYRRVLSNGTNVAKPYPVGLDRVGITDLYHKYNFSGDTMIVFVTKKIKDYSFPVFSDERFVSEVVFYSRLNQIAPMLLFEDGLYVCEYLPDGYTSNTDKLMIKNPKGTALACLSEAYYSDNLVYRVKNYAQSLALSNLFSFSMNKANVYNYKISFYIKMLAWIFKGHYIKLFEGIKKKYDE